MACPKLLRMSHGGWVTRLVDLGALPNVMKPDDALMTKKITL